MNKVILTPKKAVNEEKMLKIGFYAITAGLCGLLTGPAGCSLPKRDISVSLPAHNVFIREPAPLTLPVENVVHANNKYHQKAYLVFTQTRCVYINKLKSLDTEIKQIEKISEKELRAKGNYPLLEEHITKISIFEEPSKRAVRRNRKVEEIDVRISELEEEVKDYIEKRNNHPKYKTLYYGLIKTRSEVIKSLVLTKKRWLLLFDYEDFLKNWYLSKLTANQPASIKKRYPRLIQAQYITKLGVDRRAIKDTSSPEWEVALYHVIKPNARHPEDDNFNALAFEIDAIDSTVSLKPEAYEDEPFTGQIVFMLPSQQAGWAVIERGLMIRSTTEPTPIPTPEKIDDDSETPVQGRLYQSYEQGQVTRSSFFVVDLAGKTFRGSLFDSKGLRLGSQDYRTEEEKLYAGIYEGNPKTTVDEFNRTKLILSDNGQVRKWTYDINDKNKIENESNGSWTLIDGQVHLHLSTGTESTGEGMISNKMILEMNSENQLALIAEVRPDGRRTEIFAEPGKRFVHLKFQQEEGVLILPEGTILASQAEVRGDDKGFFIFKRTDDVKLNKLNAQIEAATDPAERSRLEGELLKLRLAGASPYTGKIVAFWDEKGIQKKREETIFDGMRTGKVIWWHANGQKQFEGEYLKDVPQGMTETYSETGQTLSQKFWENDQLVSAQTWDHKGQKSGDVDAGNGTLRYFHPNGQEQFVEKWEDGVRTSLDAWDETGKKLESGSPDYLPIIPKKQDD